MVFSLPLTTYALFYICPNADHCSILEVPQLPALESIFTYEATAVFLIWFAFQALLYMVLPGGEGEGLPIKRLGNKKLKYKFNG